MIPYYKNAHSFYKNILRTELKKFKGTLYYKIEQIYPPFLLAPCLAKKKSAKSFVSLVWRSSASIDND